LDTGKLRDEKAERIQALRAKHRNVLTIVLVIDAVLFVVETGAGHSLKITLSASPIELAIHSRYIKLIRAF
jgi:hypothetical protein